MSWAAPEARGKQSLINLTLNLKAAWARKESKPETRLKLNREATTNPSRKFISPVEVTFFWVLFVVALLAGKFWIMIKSKKFNSIAGDWRGNPYRVGVPKMDKHRVILMAAHAM